MNIFVLDVNPRKCAEYHNNKHCIKQLLETAQLLCGVHWMCGGTYEIPYKLSHKNHPCSMWARECMENYKWLCDLGIELCEEYTYRYGKRHKSQDVVEWCISNPPKIRNNGNITRFAQAMPDEYKVKDVVESYRNYYMGAKKTFATWKKREVPIWYLENNLVSL